MSYPQARYHAPGGEVSATYRSGDTAPDLVNPGRNDTHYLATGAGTDGQFGLYRWDCSPRSGGPDPHFHRTITESFYVLAGTMELYDGSRWLGASAGDFLYVPQGGVHGFRNASDGPASMLLLFTPGAPREEYFETLVEVAHGRTMSPDERAEFMLRHDTHWLPAEPGV